MSLKYRIALIIFVLEAVMMASVLTQTISRFDATTRDHLAKAEQVVLNLLTGVGRTALLTQEYASIQPYLDQVGADSRVLRAMLADRRNVVVASLDARDIGAPLPPTEESPGRLWRTVPISNTSGNFGTVAVEFSNEPLEAASRRIRRQAIVTAAAGMGLIAVVGMATGIFLTRRLERLSVAAQRLESGELEARSNVDGNDEIGQLGSTFDSMARGLEAAENALRERAEHYRSLVENAPISIHEIDLEGQLLSMSQTGRAMMHIPQDSAETRFLHLVDEDCRNAASASLDRARRGEASEFEFTRTAMGSSGTFLSGFYPIKDDSGRVVKIMGLAQDITERRRTEKALEASESQLRQAQKMEAIGLLAGGVAHDFNNILTVISGYSGLMQESADPSHRARMEAISTAAERAASLTHQLLAFSRQQVLQPRVIDLNAAVTETKKMLTRMIGEDIEIVAKLDPELGNVKADPGQIHQVVMNLGVNARDAMPKGGRLLLETRNVDISELDARARDGLRPGAYVMLAARDNGVGMDDEVASHIFEPFFTTKEHSSGTGLGLSTVYGIVKQSGGYVDVTSTPGDGSVFEILLPRVNDRVHAVTKLEGQRKEGTGTILLVEDDEAVRALAHDILSSHGYSILQASDGAMALRLLDEHCDEIGLMITDLVMPHMQGPELASKVAERRPDIKVLFTTGYFAGAPRSAIGAEEHMLKKPFTAATLLAKVDELVDHRLVGQ